MEKSESFPAVDGVLSPSLLASVTPGIQVEKLGSSVSSRYSDYSDHSGADVACDSACHNGERRLIDQVVSCQINHFYQLLFTPSTFFVDTLRSQNITGIDVGTWMPPNSAGERTRTTHFTVPVTGPGFSKIAATQYLRILSCSKHGYLYSVDAKMTHSGIPYGESFYVQIHYCVQRLGPNSTRLIVSAELKYVKNVWRFVKKFIEDIAWSSLEKFYKALGEQVLNLNSMNTEQRKVLMSVSQFHAAAPSEEEEAAYLQAGMRRKSLSSTALDKLLANTGESQNTASSAEDVKHQKPSVGPSHLLLPGVPPTPPPRRARSRNGSACSTPNAKFSRATRKVLGATPYERKLVMSMKAEYANEGTKQSDEAPKDFTRKLGKYLNPVAEVVTNIPRRLPDIHLIWVLHLLLLAALLTQHWSTSIRLANLEEKSLILMESCADKRLKVGDESCAERTSFQKDPLDVAFEMRPDVLDNFRKAKEHLVAAENLMRKIREDMNVLPQEPI